MNLKQGTLVKVLAGSYKDSVGVIDDIQPECSAMRIATQEGHAYAMLDAVQTLPSEEPARLKTTKAPLRKR